jgi:hypothetical protein
MRGSKSGTTWAKFGVASPVGVNFSSVVTGREFLPTREIENLLNFLWGTASNRSSFSSGEEGPAGVIGNRSIWNCFAGLFGGTDEDKQLITSIDILFKNGASVERTERVIRSPSRE